MGDEKIILGDAKVYRDNELHINLFYPTLSNIKYFCIGLMDVRAADNIRVGYDYERDGWVIEQMPCVEHDGFTVIETVDEPWQEVAFVGSWALARKE